MDNKILLNYYNNNEKQNKKTLQSIYGVSLLVLQDIYLAWNMTIYIFKMYFLQHLLIFFF